MYNCGFYYTLTIVNICRTRRVRNADKEQDVEIRLEAHPSKGRAIPAIPQNGRGSTLALSLTCDTEQAGIRYPLLVDAYRSLLYHPIDVPWVQVTERIV